MDIKKSSSADHFTPIDSSHKEEDKPRPNSAPARLSGSSISFRFTEPKKGLIKIPTPFELAEEEKAAVAVENYYSARNDLSTKQGKEKPSLWRSLFGSQAQKDISKSFQILAKHQDFHLDQAIKESKREFRAQIAAAGGNPDIAETVFETTAGIPDTFPNANDRAQTTANKSLKKIQQTSEPSIATPLKSSGTLSSDQLSDTDEEEMNDYPRGVWRNVDPDAPQGDQRDFEKTSAIPLSLQNFHDRFDSLSQKEIVNFIDSLSNQDRITLAENYLSSDLHDMIPTMSAPELNTFLINSFLVEHKQAQAEIPLTSPQAQQAITEAFLKRPAPIEHQGLHNSGVDCYLSSALQCLRRHFSSLPQGTQQVVLASLQDKYKSHLDTLPRAEDNITTVNSPLIAFLEGKFDGQNHFAAAFLRKEVQRVMQELSQSERNPSAAATEIAGSIDLTTGNSQQQCDTSEALVALMEYLETPRVVLEERDTYHATGQVRPSDNQQERQDGGELIVPFGIEKASSLQEVIHSNWIADHTGANALKDPDGSKHDVHKERALVNPPDSITISLSRFRMKPDPKGGWAQDSKGKEIVGVPKLAVDNLGHPIREKLKTPISHLTDNVTFSTRNHEGEQTETTYAPSSIICHYGGESANSGHYATYCKEGENWFLVNDAQVTQVNLDAPMAHGSNTTYRNFLEENAYVVNFRKIA